MSGATPSTIQRDLEQYLQLCKEEVRGITGIKFWNSYYEGRPLLDFSFEIEGWTHGELIFNLLYLMYVLHWPMHTASCTERLVQVASIREEIQVSRNFDLFLLLELHYDEPRHLLQQYENARDMTRLTSIPIHKDKELHQLRQKLPPSVAFVLTYTSTNDSLRRVYRSKKGVRRHSKR
jgi:hypothetical protein